MLLTLFSMYLRLLGETRSSGVLILDRSSISLKLTLRFFGGLLFTTSLEAMFEPLDVMVD